MGEWKRKGGRGWGGRMEDRKGGRVEEEGWKRGGWKRGRVEEGGGRMEDVEEGRGGMGTMCAKFLVCVLYSLPFSVQHTS